MTRHLTLTAFQNLLSEITTQVSKYYNDPANLGVVNAPDENATSQYVNRMAVQWFLKNGYTVAGTLVDASNVANLIDLVKAVEDAKDMTAHVFTTNQRTEAKVGFDFGLHWKVEKANGGYTSYTYFFQAKQVEMKIYPALTLEKDAEGVLSNITKQQKAPKNSIPYVNFFYTGNSQLLQVSVLLSIINKVQVARPDSIIGGGVIMYSPGGIYLAPPPDLAIMLKKLSEGDLAKKAVVLKNAALSLQFLNDQYLFYKLSLAEAKAAQDVGTKVSGKDALKPKEAVDPKEAAETRLIMEVVSAMEKAKIDDKNAN